MVVKHGFGMVLDGKVPRPAILGTLYLCDKVNKNNRLILCSAFGDTNHKIPPCYA